MTGRQPVVVGIDALPFAKDLGLTERHSGALAVLGALDDAGIDATDVDGLLRYGYEDTTEMEMARILGVPNLRIFGDVDFGGGAGPVVVAHACEAIELGRADVVVVWRARNRGSAVRPWSEQLRATGQDQFERPMGIVRPVDGMALHARIWMDRWGWRPEDLGLVAITQREHAQSNPAALMRAPLTMDDYLDSRLIADPLRLYDCCLETDGALAMVLTSAQRAADLDVDPVYVQGYGIGSGPDSYGMTFFYGDELGVTPGRYVAPELWRNTELEPTDIDVCQIYDAFTPQVPIFFQEYGFCADGEGPSYLRSDGAVPYNTSGGGLSEAYVHGFNLLVEGVRQARGSAVNQVPDVRYSLVTGGHVVPSGAVVFSPEPR